MACKFAGLTGSATFTCKKNYTNFLQWRALFFPNSNNRRGDLIVWYIVARDTNSKNSRHRRTTLIPRNIWWTWFRFLCIKLPELWRHSNPVEPPELWSQLWRPRSLKKIALIDAIVKVWIISIYKTIGKELNGCLSWLPRLLFLIFHFETSCDCS